MTAMAGTTKPNRSKHLAGEAPATVAGAFEAERRACKAMASARHEHDYQGMAAIVPALMEARVRRLNAAFASRRLTVIDTPIGDEGKVSPGMYLVEPPQVGADARRLRLAALEQNVPAAVLCREPLTRIKLLPVVAISPGSTVRVKVHPPKNLDKPDIPWFIAALQALGDMAIETIDPSMPAVRRVDALLERLDAVPEHEGLHKALQQTCLEAHAEREQAKASRAARSAATGQASESSGNNDDDLADFDESGEGEGSEA